MQLTALCKALPVGQHPFLHPPVADQSRVYGWQRLLSPKMWLVMKMTTFLLLLGSLHVSATALSQNVTLSERNASLEKIFREVKKQTGYDFWYENKLLKQARTVNVEVQNVPIEQVLNLCFQNQPLSYRIVDKTIVVTQKEKVLSGMESQAAVVAPPPPIDVTVIVLDSAGLPLNGASVLVKGTKRGIPTDVHGRAVLKGMTTVNTVLVVSFTGYVTQEVKLSNSLAVVHLQPSTSELDRVQIIAYGTESRRFSVGSVATVTAETIEKQPVTNLLLALEGQVPGLNIIAQNGVPGSTTLVQVRGQNSLSTTNANFTLRPYDQPYFIVDGVPFAAQNTNVSQFVNLAYTQSYNGGVSQATGIGAFNNINPNDIESITILKDADATAIYGSKGANGVVLITTKKGKAGKTVLDININSQFNQVARSVQLLNTPQYLQIRNAAFAQDNLTPTVSSAPDLLLYDQNKYTNWQKIIQGRNTNNTDVHASVSGGSGNTTYLFSGGYTRSDYNYPGDFSDQRYTLHSALHTTSLDKKFTLDFVTDLAYDKNISAGFGGSQDILLPPNAPDQIDGNGNLIWAYKGVPIYSNFYSYLLDPNTLQTYNFNNSLSINYEIIKGLRVGVTMGYNRNDGNEHSINPISSQFPASYDQRSANFGTTTDQSINIEPQINYTRTIGKGTLTALIGGTYQKNTTDAYSDIASGYSSDNFLNSINGATSNYVLDFQTLVKYVALFGRLKYVYDQKYILEVTGRRDGSSNFGPGHQFGNFGSVGAGWIFSEEKAVKDVLPFLSYGKLSGSYGTTGQDASQPYKYQALYSPFPSANTGNYGITPDFAGIKQNIPINLYNPDFKWSTKKSINIGLDLGFFNNRLLLNANYYRDRQGDQLIDYPLAAQAGFSQVFENEGAVVQNKGFEFTLTSNNIKSKNFTWTTSFNIGLNRNKLLEFPNLAISSYASTYVIGQPVSVVWGYNYKDVNPATGSFEFYAANGTVTSSPNYKHITAGGDQIIIGNRETNFEGGFGNTFTYKMFSIYIFCQFTSGNQPNALYALYSAGLPGSQVNLPSYIMGKYWTTPGQEATIQRLASSSSLPYNTPALDFKQSTGGYSNDTYLRVKTVAVSYTLPDAWTKKVGMKNARLFLNAQNLFTFTNYKFGDPEQPGTYSTFPLQRIIAFGLNLKF